MPDLFGPSTKETFMKFKFLVLASTIAVTLTACDKQQEEANTTQDKAQAEVVFDTQIKKFSYVVGVDMGGQLRTSDIQIDREAFALGLSDSLDSHPPRIAKEELVGVVQAFHDAQQAKVKQHEDTMRTASESNIKAGSAFLAENSTKDGVNTTESGLQYKVIAVGSGAMPTADSRVEVNYRGTLIDGTEFDASTKHGGSVELNVSEVIPGWTEALQRMKEGAKWELYLPSELAYGPQGTGGIIGPSATLIFEVELLKVLGAE